MTSSRKLFIAAFVLLLASVGWAQTETGSIVGTVTDPSGAVVPNTQVTLTRTDTGQTRTANTGPNGVYNFTNLQPGTYDVIVGASGFGEFRRRVQVTVGSRNTVDANLAATGGTTTVEVVAQGGAEVNTQDQMLSQVVNATQITQLPTLTRNPYDLVMTAGNVSEGDPSGQIGRGVGAAINGQRSASTNILLDGAENVDLFDADVGQAVPLDSVQEFRVHTSNFTAEYGRATGGIVNVATRAGTNDFHGSLYEFNRISALASNTYQNNATGTPKPRFVRNQFGYSLGGPIVRDKLFFFSSTEWTRVRSQLIEQAYVPTAQFLGLTSPATQAFFNQFGTLAPQATLQNSVITAGDLTAALQASNDDPTASPGPTFAALPPTTPVFQLVNYRFQGNAGGGDPQNTYSTVGRIDFNATDRTTLYARYALEHLLRFEGTNGFSPYTGYNTGIRDHNHNALLNLTHIWTPSVVTQSKVTFNRLNNLQPLGAAPAGPTLYPQPTTSFSAPGTAIDVAFPGYLPFNPGSAIPFGGPQNLYQFFQDLSWSSGNHQFRIGGSYIHTRDNRTFGAFQNAVESLAPQGSFLDVGLENMLTGQLFSFQGAVDPQGAFPCVFDPVNNQPIVTPQCTVTLPVQQPRFSRNNRYHDFSAYLQDGWKVIPRLTLNLGVRWDYFGVQHNADERLDSNFYYGQGATEAERIRNGSVMLAPNSPVGGLWASDWNNFAPRVGFAWDLFGTGTSSLRGGYGISYERNFGNVTFNVIQNPPNYAVVAITNGVDVPTLDVTSSNSGPLAGTGAVPLPRSSLRWIDQNIRASYAHLYSLAFEHQVATNTVLALEYSGSRGLRQYTIEDPNRPGSGIVYGDDPDQGVVTATTPEELAAAQALNRRFRLNRQFTSLNRRNDAGDSYYNGLNVSLRSNNFRNSGLTLTANYTWAHAIDTLSSTFSESQSNYNLGLLDPFNPELDRGNADFDIRHRFSFSAVYETPWLRGDHGWAGQVLGGWSLAPIFTARTGTPFTLFDCTNGFAACARPIFDQPNAIDRGGVDDVGAPTGPNTFTYMTIPSFTSWINPLTGTSDFGACTTPGQGATQACPFPAGMERRNAFRQPGVWNLDLGLYKNFRFTERVGLQLRGEAYNIFNHSNLYVDPGSIDVSSSSTVNAARGRAALFSGLGAAFDERRNLQLGVKINF